MTASLVARPHGINPNQLFHWRKQLCGPAREKPGFAAVTVSPSAGSSNMIEVEFANGARLRITGATDGAIAEWPLVLLPWASRQPAEGDLA